MHCHTQTAGSLIRGNSIALVGHPNVGKSVIFQRLTGQRVIVSNYPGTTVEVARGSAPALGGSVIFDTPGVITFPPQSEDEQVTERVLLYEPLKAIIQVGDAKNLRRTLALTIQLVEMGIPMALSLNMMDEAGARGVSIDAESLAAELGIPVIPTTAIRGSGVSRLTQAVQTAARPDFAITYSPEIEAAVAEIAPLLPEASISPRSLALLWLSGDPLSQTFVGEHLEQPVFERVQAAGRTLAEKAGDPAALIHQSRQAHVEKLICTSILESGEGWQGLSAKLGKLTTHSLWGFIFLGVVMYALYWFVGVFGAGTLVGLLEENLFGEIINPFVTGVVQKYVPITLVSDLLVGEYGLWTMGMTYAFALILPIVSTFFLAFGVLEDSGYLPRLAALSNRVFRTLGLNGKAVLPMVLGLGCVTMATLTTRVLEKKRERLLVTLLLALAVPCSAQLGVVMGMLAGISFGAAAIWAGLVLAVLFVVGWLAARLVPGERTQLLVELPPLRMPVFSNVVMKTLARLEWYLKEVVPLFLLGTFILFLLDLTSVLDFLTRAGEPLVSGWLGLPAEASSAFLIGFLRRDFGATGLFLMQSRGLLDPVQVVVAMVTITLFIPCIASVMMIARERGWRTAAGMLVLIFPLAFLVGGLVYRILLLVGWGG